MGAIALYKVAVLVSVLFQELLHAGKCLDGTIEYAHQVGKR